MKITSNSENFEVVIKDILQERGRQVVKWGEQTHELEIFLAILSEEVGELAQAMLEQRFPKSSGHTTDLYKEATHVAAVAVSILEGLTIRGF
jgi:NTP pyrophosphatase (non-canonical NTP hydrolase)